MSAYLTAGELLDREAIRDCIYRYCWAVDRRDQALFQTVYWPEAIDDRRPQFLGPAADAIKWILGQVAAHDLTQHTIGNILIRIDGSAARSESHFISYNRSAGGGLKARSENLIGGRYIDRWEKRAGEWRIIYRHGNLDWVRSFAGEGGEAAYAGRISSAGRKSSDDPVYAVFSDGIQPLKLAP